MSRSLTFVKLGGSLITDKTRTATPRPERLGTLAREIAEARAQGAGALLLGHGSGSYGHVEAHRHGLDRPPADARQWLGVARTQDRAAALHRLVIEALLREEVPTFSWAPASVLVARNGVPEGGDIEPLGRALDAGLVPVVFGDVVMDRTRGASICSTERVFRFLATALPAADWRVARVLWMGETKGVWDADGAILPTLDEEALSSLAGAVGGARGTDVTGGMVHRLQAALELAGLGVESWLLDGRERGRLLQALLGEPSGGTHVPSRRSAFGGDAPVV